MIGRLYNYFGVIGCLSVVAWIAALVLLVVFIRHRQRVRFYLVALGLASVGVVLAQINSRRVSAVRLEEVPNSPKQYVEEITTEAGVPAYRQQGKQRRETGKSEPVELEAKKTERTFKETELLEANRLDRWNLLLADGALILVLLALVTDYLARFHRTTGGSYPLPLPGQWIDRLFPKKRTVLTGGLDLKAYLETVVRRGETFLYFTAADPWQATALPRLGQYLRLPKIVYGDPAHAEFYFDAAWFNRYCIVVPAADAPQVFGHLETYLNWRSFTKATARRTVNIVWDLPTPPAENLLRELIPLFRDANFKLVVKSPAANRELFEEVQS